MDMNWISIDFISIFESTIWQFCLNHLTLLHHTSLIGTWAPRYQCHGKGTSHAGLEAKEDVGTTERSAGEHPLQRWEHEDPARPSATVQSGHGWIKEKRTTEVVPVVPVVPVPLKWALSFKRQLEPDISMGLQDTLTNRSVLTFFVLHVCSPALGTHSPLMSTVVSLGFWRFRHNTRHITHRRDTEAEINAQTVLAMKEASVLRSQHFLGCLSTIVCCISGANTRKANEKLKQQQKQMGVEDALAPDRWTSTCIQRTATLRSTVYWKPWIELKGRKTNRRDCGHASRDEGFWYQVPYVSVASCCEWN